MTKLTKLDNGPGKVKNIPKINYDRGIRPNGTSSRVAKDIENKKTQKSNDKLRSSIESKLKVTLTYNDYMNAWNGFPDLDPSDIIQGIAKRKNASSDIIIKQMDKFAKADGYKNFYDGYMDQVSDWHKNNKSESVSDCRVCGQTPCNCTMIESKDKSKLKTLAHQNPEAADAAAALIRAYMDNPKKPISQIITKVIEETGIAKAQLMKIIAELGINFEE